MVSLAGLGTRSNLGPSVSPTITFEPTLGIAAARIDKLGLDIRSFKVPLKRAVQEVMAPSFTKNFDEGGRPSWEPLAEDTIFLREGDGYGAGPILERTGTLKTVAGQLNIWDISTTAAVIRDLPDRAWYGKVHQAGYEGSSMTALIKKNAGDIGAAMDEHTSKINSALSGGDDLSSQSRTSPTIPARPFLVFQDDDLLKIDDVFVLWLGERLDVNWPGV